MERVHEGLPDPGFPVPDGIVKVQICRKSGKLAIPGVCTNEPRGNAVYTEYFEAGTEPTLLCDRHVKTEICTESGQAATEFCPETAEGVFLVVPFGEGATDDSQYTLPPRCGLHGDLSSVILPPGTEGGEQKETEGSVERESTSWWESWPTQPQPSRPSWETKPTQESRPPWETKPTQESKPPWEPKPTQESKPSWETRPAQQGTQSGGSQENNWWGR